MMKNYAILIYLESSSTLKVHIRSKKKALMHKKTKKGDSVENQSMKIDRRKPKTNVWQRDVKEA